jgi:curli production assembly/transport component CsgG/holdfast attachment protein HfaB
MIKLMKLALMAGAASVSLSACVSPVAGPRGLYARPIGNAPVTANPTPYSNALVCLGDHARRSNLRAPRIAVGRIADYTGKEEAEGGRKVTQGASLMAITALAKAGVQLVERFDTSVSELELKYANNKLISDELDAGVNGDYRRIRAGQVPGSDFYLVGGITELNYNIRSSGIEAFGGDTSPRDFKGNLGGRLFVMNVGLDLRLVETKTLEVVDVISYQKQIIAREVSVGVFDFLNGNIFDISAGEGAQEPVQLAVRSLIERGVLEMSANLYGVAGPRPASRATTRCSLPTLTARPAPSHPPTTTWGPTMLNPAKNPRAGTRLARTSRLLPLLLSCAAATSAFAQDGTVVLNDQVQLGDVFAEQLLLVEEATEGLASATTAVGNSVSASTENLNLDFTSSQRLGAAVGAESHVQARGSAGEVFVNSTSATGNTADGAMSAAYLGSQSHQTVEAHAPVTASAYSAAGRTTVHASGAATAIGNSQGYAALNGNVEGRTVQTNHAVTDASNVAAFCCITGSGSFTSTAVSNSVSSAVENGESIHDVSQVRSGADTRAYNNVYVVTGNNVTGAAAASANTVSTYNTGAYAELRADQTNDGGVNAENYVILDNWYGTGSSIAYGVGNTISLVNVSPDPLMRTSQVNSGDIDSTAVFDGGAGEHVYTSATSVGNATSGYACSTCYGIIDATNHQTNSGAVRASARTYVAGTSGFVTGTSTAIGNSASYESRQP